MKRALADLFTYDASDDRRRHEHDECVEAEDETGNSLRHVLVGSFFGKEGRHDGHGAEGDEGRRR